MLNSCRLTRYYSLSTPAGTVTGTALDTTYSAYNKYARKGDVKHITVVITDGRCTCKESVITTAVAPLKTASVYIHLYLISLTIL